MAQQRVGIRNGSLFNNNSTLWNGLLAYYTGDGTANDALGNYNGTLVNGATYGTGKINNGFLLDGINDYVALPNGCFNPSGSFTISAWFNISSLPTLKMIFNVGGFLNNSICVYIRTGATTFLLADGAGYQLLDAPFPSFNTWSHVVCVKDTVSNKYLIYYNGSLARQATITTNQSLPSQGTSIGSNRTNSFFTGGIDEVGLWDGKALTATEVTELYNSGNGKQYPN
jgi:hypothetical protein